MTGPSRRPTQVRGKPGLALVLNHENITDAFYHGNERPMLIANAIFRMGGNASLFTTRPQGMVCS